MEICYRTYADTQILKENGKPTEKEWEIIKTYIKDCPYEYLDDEANGWFAISFNDINQRKNEDWGRELVSMLNNAYCENDEYEPWFLGDKNEEYVFCF